ncbi:MAG: hypothetical protein JWM57_4095, partial [Phycisphaerales bacterium]|nr:hypothetical protein [Phycisphaerales bacterium]
FGDGWTQQSKSDYLKQFMTVIFSEPQFTSFGNWGFWDGKEFNGPDAGLLYDLNWNLKQTGQTYMDLVFKDWWTSVNGVTAAGQYGARGFLGSYKIDVTALGKTVSQTTVLDADGTTLTVIIPEPASALPILGLCWLGGRRRSAV